MACLVGVQFASMRAQVQSLEAGCGGNLSSWCYITGLLTFSKSLHWTLCKNCMVGSQGGYAPSPWR